MNLGCNPGFVLVGAPTLVCQATPAQVGQWSSAVPVCQQLAPPAAQTTAAPTTEAAPTCSALDPPANGATSGVCIEGSPVGSVCNFTCNTGAFPKRLTITIYVTQSKLGFQITGTASVTCQ